MATDGLKPKLFVVKFCGINVPASKFCFLVFGGSDEPAPNLFSEDFVEARV